MSENTCLQTDCNTNITPHSCDEDAVPSDDTLDVDFGDPVLMGDESSAFAEEVGSYFTKQQFIDWMAVQRHALKERIEVAARLMQTAIRLRAELEAQYRFSPELPSQTPNHSTQN